MGDAATVSGLPLVCRGVSVSRGATRILADIDVEIVRGRRAMVLGANGSGKSTLLRVMHGLVTPDAGTVTWDSRMTRPAGQAMVFQRAVMLRRSASANLRYALALAGVHGVEADRRIDEALAEVGLSALAKRSARVLSGGEQQRLALARAWALAPEVLFLDEPTASLDPKASRAVEDIVRNIHARGTTIVMSTHNLAQAKRLADDVLFLHEGRLREHAPPAVFFSAPRTAEAVSFLEGERL
jgi:tungstate transport system ATP-binding protein